MMSQTTLPKFFWDYALKTAAHILNMVPTKKVKKTPYKVWHGQAPKLSYLKVWGCEALVKRDTLTKPDKLEPISIKCIFVGYPKEMMRYSFYYPPENKVLVARNTEFLENSLINQEASGSLEDLEIIQEEDTHPSIDTSLNHEEDDLEIDEPQSDIVLICRSTRTRHASDRMCLYIDAEEHELGDLGEPANYKAAFKWLFKKKTDMDENVHTYKAYLVAKGYTQTLMIDYEETFSLVADIRAIRILIAIAAYYDFEIWQIDVKTTFLNGYLNEEIYMEKPKGFVNPKYPNRNLGDLYWTTVKNILKYLRNTKDMFLVYGECQAKHFATSSTEAEYIAAVWVRKFISGLGVVPTIEEPISMYCDNTRAIAIANESGITKDARHFHVKVHYLREVIEYSDIKLKKVHTDDNLADPFTKALAFLKHSKHTRNIRMLPINLIISITNRSFEINKKNINDEEELERGIKQKTKGISLFLYPLFRFVILCHHPHAHDLESLLTISPSTYALPLDRFDNNVSLEEEVVHQRLRKTLTHVLELSLCVNLDDRARGVFNFNSAGVRFNFRRTTLTRFPAQSICSSNTIALDSPNLLVLNTEASQSRQHESRKPPTAELFDVDSGRISIRHCEY
nr:retrotransposon protein, putative, Ty1-copia subclass [Tanacetum cinerariifolium]GEZ69928.1 retrotransposon protein, putative, Ty1-copia subclass [Tanacetum cinerariifolium]